MSSLYITEIPKEIDTKEVNKDQTKEIQHEFLNYLIEKETKYADIEKIETYYLTQTYEKKKKFNENVDIIKKKEKECNDLLMTIAEKLLLNYCVANTSFIQYYELAIEKLKHQIKIKEHEKDIYSNNYNRLYHTNFMIKKRIDIELNYERIADKQFVQYKILKSQAQRKYLQQQKILNNMKNYSEKSNMKFKDDRGQKAKKINHLEFEVEMIKKDCDKIESKITKIKEKSEKVSAQIKIYNTNINNEKKYYALISKDYHQLHISLLKIFKALKVKHLTDVITNFNKIRDNYQNLKSSFFYSNLEIARLTGTLSELDNELKDVNNKIELKVKKENYDLYEDQQMRKTTGLIREAKFNLSEVKKLFENKTCFLQTILNFIYSNIQSIYQQHPALHSLLIKDVSIFLNTKKELIIPPETEDPSFLKSMCQIFIQFSNFLFYLLLKSMSSGVNEFSSYNKQENSLIPLYSRKSVVIYSKEVQKALDEMETKKLIMRKNEKEINALNRAKTHRDFTPCNQLNRNHLVSQSQMFEQFMNYMEDNKWNKPGYLLSANSRGSVDSSVQGSTFYETRQKFIKDNSRKIKSIFCRFENELVYRDKNQSEMKTFYPSQKGKLVNSNSTGELMLNRNLKRKKAIISQSTNAFSLPYMDDNMEVDLEDYLNISDDNYKTKDDSIEEEKKKSKSQYNFFKNDKEQKTIYSRKNDIRKLELTYLKGIEKNNKSAKHNDNIPLSNNHEFMEVYYEFMKKYGKKYSTKPKKKITRKRHANTVYTKVPPPKILSIEPKEEEQNKGKTPHPLIRKRTSCGITFNIKNILSNQITKDKMYKSKSELNITKAKSNNNKQLNSQRTGRNIKNSVLLIEDNVNYKSTNSNIVPKLKCETKTTKNSNRKLIINAK